MRRNTYEDVFARLDTSGGPDACHEWQGATVGKGEYGVMRVNYRMCRVSRIVLVLCGKLDDMDDPRLALHSCDNPKCGNERHLFAGTSLDNTQDMLTKGRANKVKGEAHYAHQRMLARQNARV